MTTIHAAVQAASARLLGGLVFAVMVTTAPVYALGCERSNAPKHLFSCRCDFLTDTDGASAQRVDVCAADTDGALEAATGCAQAAAPAPIQGCRCEAASGPCPTDDCKAHDHR